MQDDCQEAWASAAARRKNKLAHPLTEALRDESSVKMEEWYFESLLWCSRTLPDNGTETESRRHPSGILRARSSSKSRAAPSSVSAGSAEGGCEPESKTEFSEAGEIPGDRLLENEKVVRHRR